MAPPARAAPEPMNDGERDQEYSYLLPRAVRARLEIAAGLGPVELLAVAAAGGLGFGLQLLWSHLPLAAPALRYGVRTCLFGLPPVSAYLALRPDLGGLRVIDHLIAARDYRHRIRRYLYRRQQA